MTGQEQDEKRQALLGELDQLLPFIQENIDRRKQDQLLDLHEEVTVTESASSAMRMPKLAALAFTLFIVGAQVYTFAGNSSEQKSRLRQFLTQTEKGDSIYLEEKEIAGGPLSTPDDQPNGTLAELEERESGRLRASKDLSDFLFQLPQVAQLPDEIEKGYGTVWDPYDPLSDTPVLFHIPRSGGTTMKVVTSTCLNLTQASNVGPAVDAAAATATELMVLTDKEQGGRYVNVDTTWPGGLYRAQLLGLGPSRIADIIVTPYFYHAADLFGDHVVGHPANPASRGKAFTIMRHPIDRAVSMYHHLVESMSHDGALDPGLRQAMEQIRSLEDYAKSPLLENNWITRFLTNTLSGELMPKHEALARKILHDKFLVGLLSDPQQSLERFMAYYGWTANGNEGIECIERNMGWDWVNRGSDYEKVEEGSRVWDLIENSNTFDIRLYEYAQVIFREQAIFFQ